MASSNKTPRIVELAVKINTHVTELQELLSAQGVPSPSFDEDSPERLPPSTFHLQDAVLDATAELHELLMDPIPLAFKFSATTNMISIDAICRFHIADIIPSGGQVSFGEIAEKTKLDEPLVRRLVRHAMSMHIFREPEPGMVAHTKISKYFTLPYVNDWLSFGAREGWPAATKMLDAIQKWPGSEESNETGFCLANNTDKSIFEVLRGDHTRAMRLASAVKAHDHFPGEAAIDVPKLYDWASLGNGLIVHVGGSRGEVAVELAKSFKDARLLVQDMEMVVKGAKDSLPDELKDRIDFKANGLFDTQTVEADAYLFRLVFQIWPDKYALKILKAQIPALRPGAKILIQDTVAPEPGEIPLWRERELRAMDLNTGAAFNGRHRYIHEWKALLAEADERFVFQGVSAPGRTLLSTLEIVWDPSSFAKA
ncbi:sterigmatocystin 8-O-methyltransferase [Hypoxylon trugodes]|uniref:sterigmatocystin 8-O-methyltransferase n=1 Tax=Hypoxylon trugodes TaxID=326681 RepID=UPI002195B14E|nr:sterigmatocystin 8-O-methyltransferase [Hypoxylon trugodes]KAI1386464.1 sterigmatocystin 8-O-methyltransferase [Hypoxylon trugodes]